jgi:hypothetical protein
MGFYDTWNQPSARMQQAISPITQPAAVQTQINDPNAIWSLAPNQNQYPSLYDYVGQQTSNPNGMPSALQTAGTYEYGGYYWTIDANGVPKILGEVGNAASPTTMTPYQQAQVKQAQDELAWQQQQASTLTPYQQAQLQAQQQSSWQDTAYQQQQLAADQQYRQQQLQQEQQNRLATLAANPKSWLEYAATANQQPVIQPWMLPLMPQEYAGANLPAAGAIIPGWNAQNMQGMPDLITPSAQYWARMGPTAQQQYYGYQQADQAMIPEESQFRMWNMAPPRGAMSFNQVR